MLNTTYLFFRKYIVTGDISFYPLDLPDADEQIIDHVKLNPGTIKVEKINGELVYHIVQEKADLGELDAREFKALCYESGVECILPGELVTNDTKLDNSRFFAEFDANGKIKGGYFK